MRCLDEPIAAACELGSSFVGLSKEKKGTIKPKPQKLLGESNQLSAKPNRYITNAIRRGSTQFVPLFFNNNN